MKLLATKLSGIWKVTAVEIDVHLGSGVLGFCWRYARVGSGMSFGMSMLAGVKPRAR